MRRVLIAVAGTVAAFGFAGIALAQTTEEMTRAQVAALGDLSAVYGAPVVRLDQAKAICNEEQYLADCANIGRKHDLFSGERAKQVDTLLTELKGDAVEKLKRCADVSCLVDVATSLASGLSSRNLAVAKAVELTAAKMEEKRTIVETAKSLGVDMEACRTMDPETAAVELLRGCARLAKHENMQKYIPPEVRERMGEADAAIELKESLENKELACGDNTLEGCGKFCLKPSPEAGAIPPVCRAIASRFFGQKGVEELESAYSKVQNTFDTFSERARNVVFTTADGRTFTDPAAIGKYMEEAGSRGDVNTVARGMDFLQSKGLVTAQDRDFALAMVKKINERGPVNLDVCREDPSRCAEVVPEEKREQFTAMGEVDKVMRGELTARGIDDPSRCSADASAGASCLEAARAALPQMELFAETSEAARRIVSDIRQKVRFGEAGQDARAKIEERFKTEGNFSIGEQRFGSVGEVDVFCRQNPEQCLAETVREGIFSKDVAAEKYERVININYNYNYNLPPPNVMEQRGQVGPANPADQIGQTGQVVRRPAFNKEEALQKFKEWLDNPSGALPLPPGMEPVGPYQQPGQWQYGQYPSPYSPNLMPKFDSRNCQYAISPPPPCKAGEYRQESTNELGCAVFGSCIPLTTQTKPPQPEGMNVCPAMPTVNSCPSGEEKFIAYSSPECGTYYGCRTVKAVEQGLTFPYTFVGGKRVSSFEEARAYCIQYAGKGTVDECEVKFGVYPPAPEPIGVQSCEQRYGSYRAVDSSGNCFNSGMTEYYDPGGVLRQCATTQVFGCGPSTITTAPPSGQREQVWNSYGLRSWIRSDATPSRIEALKTSCANVTSSQANVWMPAAGTASSVDFGMPDPAKCTRAAACTSGQYFDGSNCTTTGYQQPSSCGSGQYWNGSACVSSGGTSGMKRCTYPNASRNGASLGTVWCEADYYNCREGGPSGAAVSLSGLSLGAPSSCESGWTNGSTSCPSGQYWNGSACTASPTTQTTATGSCSSELIGLLGSGCHSMGNGWFNTEMTSYVITGSQTVRNCSTEYISGCSGGATQTQTTCASGQYWNGTSCTSSPSTTSCPSGQWWNGTSCTSATTGTDYATAQQGCANAGGTWDSATNYCRMPNTTTSCSSGQYWNGSACVTSTTQTQTSTSCGSGQYWNGTSCVATSPTDTVPTDTSSWQQSCASAGGTWESGSNYCRMPSTSTYTAPSTESTYTPPSTTETSAPPPTTETSTPPPTTETSTQPQPTESAPPPTTSESPPLSYIFCPAGHIWNGAYCILAPQSALERYTANVLSALRSLIGF